MIVLILSKLDHRFWLIFSHCLKIQILNGQFLELN